MCELTYQVANPDHRVVFLKSYIEIQIEKRGRLAAKYKRCRVDHSRHSVNWAIREVDFQVANAASEIAALTNPLADVQFVITAGERYVGKECSICHRKFAYVDKPVVVTRKNGEWSVHCYICNDAKYEPDPLRKKC